MELKSAAAPYFRQREPLKSMILSRLAAALALLIPALFVYGLRSLILAGAGVLGAVIIEAVWRFFEGREQTLGDLTAVTTGVLVALLLPPTVPVWLPLAGAAFAVGAVKLPFGGFGRSPFSAETGGVCFAALIGANLASFYNTALLSPIEQQLFTLLPKRCFAAANGSLPLFGDVRINSQSISEMLSTQMKLRTGGDPGLDFLELLFGSGRGSLGMAVPFCLLLCAAWLLIRRVLAWQAVLGYAAVMTILSLICSWRGVRWYEMPGYELLTGSALLCAVFLLGDIFTAPHTDSGRLIYGAGCALLTVIFRRVGSTEGGEVFAVLMMNAAASPIDRFVWYCRGKGFSLQSYRRRITAKLRKRFGSKGRFDIDVDELYAELEREKPKEETHRTAKWTKRG